MFCLIEIKNKCVIIIKKQRKFDMRKKLYSIIEPINDNNKLSNIYDFVMMATILISIIPLAFKETNTVFKIMDTATVLFSFWIICLDLLLLIIK